MRVEVLGLAVVVGRPVAMISMVDVEPELVAESS